MHRIKKASILLISLLIFSFSSRAQGSLDWEISKNLDIYTTLLQQLNQHYVEDIQPGKMTKSAINAMLKDLDPYTVYYPESDIEDVRFLQTGKYGGIGSYIHINNDTLNIGMPAKGFPFYNAGLRAGDIILKINDTETKGLKMSEVSSLLKGPSGTQLTLVYRKYSDSTNRTVELTREQIKVKNVPYYGLLNDSIGYINLTGFTETAAKEVYEAIAAMNPNKELKSIVLDLRFNGGGLLGQAVSIMDLFVPANELIVSTKGKLVSENAEYKTMRPAVFPDLKVVVMVNNRSASASEIVAGAFQDLDRGVIIGQKSFGKGLVQKVYKLSYNSQAKITIAKYYIPSGRCIQSLDYEHKDASGKATKTADSLQALFYTQNGRPVKDAGGILPDVINEKPSMSEVTVALIQQYMIFDFASQYVLTHDTVKDPNSFTINDELFNQFVKFLSSNKFEYSTSSDRFMDAFEKQLKKDGFSDDLKSITDQLEKELEKLKEGSIEKNKDEIKKLLRVEIISRYYFLKGKVSASIRDDEEVKIALELLEDGAKYHAVLKAPKGQ